MFSKQIFAFEHTFATLFFRIFVSTLYKKEHIMLLHQVQKLNTEKNLEFVEFCETKYSELLLQYALLP